MFIRLILLLLFCVNLCYAQVCSDLRYNDSLFDVDITYNVQYQSAKPYGSVINLPYNLDVYEPDGDSLIYRPLVLFQFGGAYLIGDKLNPPGPAFCTHWAQRGYVAVSIDYRLGFNTAITGSAERAVYRGCQDLQAALRFLIDERDTYGIDTSRIIVAGNSAGAVSTLHCAFMDYDQVPASISGFGFGLDSDDLGDPWSSGNNNFGNQEVFPDALILNWGGILDVSFVGDRPDDFIPSILFHGDQDNAMPYDSGTPFGYPAFPTLYGSLPVSNQMSLTGIPHQFYTFQGAGHEPELTNIAYLDTILDYSDDFVFNHVVKPNIIGVTGNTLTAITEVETYQIQMDDPLDSVCYWLKQGLGIIDELTPGTYTVDWQNTGTDSLYFIVSNDVHAFDTICVPVQIDSALALNEIKAEGIDIYPNPVGAYLRINSKRFGSLGASFEVFDVGGKLHAEGNLIKSQIELGEIPPGIYVLTIRVNNTVYRSKFVKL